jgi:hypothetical protein
MVGGSKKTWIIWSCYNWTNSPVVMEMTYLVHTLYLLINNCFDYMRFGLVNKKIYSTVAIKLSLALYNYFCKS